ncbi:uncharacterized protein LOC121233754 isoform X2 [Aquila chrysaetos chrysaetos]|uniref:uncharacterized protein LOC121233754 isoform X2 n=1 Tax=Aquila chrysaetos chrysaetos TaxID=223781 RepID=UPI001B7D368C|nr:uncharacterized protein LOC121233754 isoform X2 [Aquila chrysaetos chrysaetos]
MGVLRTHRYARTVRRHGARAWHADTALGHRARPWCSGTAHDHGARTRRLGAAHGHGARTRCLDGAHGHGEGARARCKGTVHGRGARARCTDAVLGHGARARSADTALGHGARPPRTDTALGHAAPAQMRRSGTPVALGHGAWPRCRCPPHASAAWPPSRHRTPPRRPGPMPAGAQHRAWHRAPRQLSRARSPPRITGVSPTARARPGIPLLPVSFFPPPFFSIFLGFYWCYFLPLRLPVSAGAAAPPRPPNQGKYLNPPTPPSPPQRRSSEGERNRGESFQNQGSFRSGVSSLIFFFFSSPLLYPFPPGFFLIFPHPSGITNRRNFSLSFIPGADFGFGFFFFFFWPVGFCTAAPKGKKKKRGNNSKLEK